MPRLARTLRPGRESARTRCPTLIPEGSAQEGTASPPVASRNAATSVVGSRPTRVAGVVEPSGRPTSIPSSPSTEWLAATITPSADQTTPLPGVRLDSTRTTLVPPRSTTSARSFESPLAISVMSSNLGGAVGARTVRPGRTTRLNGQGRAQVDDFPRCYLSCYFQNEFDAGRRVRRSAEPSALERDQAQPDRDHDRSEEHTSELQSLAYLVCRLLLEKKKRTNRHRRQDLRA